MNLTEAEITYKRYIIAGFSPEEILELSEKLVEVARKEVAKENDSLIENKKTTD